MAINKYTPFGVREICNVVLKAKNSFTLGSKEFAKGEPVLYFSSLKTSTAEGAATTVYAQGGRGNSRLVAWEGEKTLTFTMEDALISAQGLAILAGADLFQASSSANLLVHKTATDVKANVITTNYDAVTIGSVVYKAYAFPLDDDGRINGDAVEVKTTAPTSDANNFLVDYYKEEEAGTQIDIEPNKFSTNFYLEAETLFRDETGLDYPAEFIIPNCKIQSNFTFTMAASGDPSTFTFTIDAFPGVVNGGTKKVLASIQIKNEATSNAAGIILPEANVASAKTSFIKD